MTLVRVLGLAIPSTLLAVSSLCARVAETTLCELTAVADVIVVARTEAVVEVEGISIARATVQKAIKGDIGRDFYFLAESTWTCDVSGAEVGETDLLFLTRHRYQTAAESDATGEDEPDIGVYREPARFKSAVRRATGSSTLMEIAWAGRGQMPLRTVAGEDYVTIWVEDVQLPTSVETVDGPEAEYDDFIRSASLEHILFLVRRYLDTCGRSR